MGVLKMLSAYDTWQLLLAPTIIVAALLFSYQAKYVIKYSRELPRVGQDKGLTWKQMREKFSANCLELFDDVYENYSKKSRSVLIPVFGPHDEVILPTDALPWLVKQPDSILSSMAAQVETIQIHRSLGHKFAYDPWGGLLIKSDLNQALEAVCAGMNEEVRLGFEEAFGTDTEEWKEVDLFAACRAVGGRATLRFTLGDSPEGRKLCQDKDFVQACYGALDGMLDVAGAVAGVRKVFQDFFAIWASRVMPAKLKEVEKRFEPVYRERLDILSKPEGKVREPQDVVQMMFRYAEKERREELNDIGDITKRLALSNFGTMHQTILTLHNILLNIVGSDDEFRTSAMLREESEKIFGPGDPSTKHWTRVHVASLVKADSVARETARLYSFIGRTVQRLVVAPGGIVTPDGVRLSKGTMVSVLAHQAQTDPENNDEPLKFNPFRFSGQREAAADKETGRPGLNNLSFASTSADYLPFSHGRHACPGRFLVDFELKMIILYAVMHYDMRFPESYEGKRPPNTWFAGFGIPPIAAKIQVRRRKN